MNNDLPTVSPQGIATTGGNMTLERPGIVIIPEIPKDALSKKTPSVWLLIAVIELVIIGWLVYKLYKIQKNEHKKS